MGEATFDPTYNAEEEDESTFSTLNVPPSFSWEQFGTFTLDHHTGSYDFSNGSSSHTEYNASILFLEPVIPSEPPAGTNRWPLQMDEEDDQYRAQHSEKSPAPVFTRSLPPSRRGTDAIDTEAEREEERPSADVNYKSGSYPPSWTEQSDASGKRRKQNKLASEKFRAKTRADTRNLKCQEQDLEDINQDLIRCVTGLKNEVCELKMQLLQHGLCNYYPIEAYISNEAVRFVNRLEQEEE